MVSPLHLLLALFCLGSTTAVRAAVLAASPQNASTPAPHAVGGQIAPAASIVEGSISEVVTAHSLGAPQGTHLIVSSAGKTVDVSTGPWLSAAVRQRLSTGTQVRVIGYTQSLHGKDYLLARQIVVNGETFTIRSQSGFLVHNVSSDTPTAAPHLRARLNGGAN